MKITPTQLKLVAKLGPVLPEQVPGADELPPSCMNEPLIVAFQTSADPGSKEAASIEALYGAVSGYPSPVKEELQASDLVWD